MAKLIKKSEATQTTEHKTSTFTAYEFSPKDFCLGISEVNGRYPQTGADADMAVAQIWYVVSGAGKVEVNDEKFEIEEGDMLHIDKGERFAIDGNLKLVVASAPVWTPEQHKHFE